MDDFLFRALIAGFGVAIVAGPLGCLIVWRRLAFFGETLAHSALLGVALGVVLDAAVTPLILAVGLLVAVLMIAAERRSRLPTDTLLGILSHTALAAGLVAFAFAGAARVDLLAYLFGDILAVDATDIAWIYAGGGAVLAALAVLWRRLLAVTVHAELAEVEGVPVTALRFAFMALMALVIAVSIKIVGILLITSLLVIPAAAARGFARTPEQMALIAIGFGCMAVALGLGGSYVWDAPSGPMIVLAAALIFALTTLSRRRGI
ncbi:MAG: metal ABC transporter permease [Alphaproteobacteria bacterium]